MIPHLRRLFVAKTVDWTYTATFTFAAAGFTLIAQILFTRLGDRYLLVNRKIIDTAVLDAATPAEVGGFTIYAFARYLRLACPDRLVRHLHHSSRCRQARCPRKRWVRVRPGRLIRNRFGHVIASRGLPINERRAML